MQVADFLSQRRERTRQVWTSAGSSMIGSVCILRDCIAQGGQRGVASRQCPRVGGVQVKVPAPSSVDVTGHSRASVPSRVALWPPGGVVCGLRGAVPVPQHDG